jgi:hypothetical protein
MDDSDDPTAVADNEVGGKRDRTFWSSFLEVRDGQECPVG